VQLEAAKRKPRFREEKKMKKKFPGIVNHTIKEPAPS
jgi:hypothetical protein